MVLLVLLVLLVQQLLLQLVLPLLLLVQQLLVLLLLVGLQLVLWLLLLLLLQVLLSLAPRRPWAWQGRAASPAHHLERTVVAQAQRPPGATPSQ